MDSEHKVLYHESELTSDQIKALVATDVELVAAPGAGKIARVIGPVILTMIPAETSPLAYTWANTDHNIFVQDATFDSDAEAQALIEASASARFTAQLRPVVTSTPLTENEAIKIGASGTGEPATGNGTLKVKFQYIVIDVTN